MAAAWNATLSLGQTNMVKRLPKLQRRRARHQLRSVIRCEPIISLYSRYFLE
jgi:hypothetical protein